MTVRCSQGHENPDGSMFCDECGERLDQGAQMSAPAAAPVAPPPIPTPAPGQAAPVAPAIATPSRSSSSRIATSST